MHPAGLDNPALAGRGGSGHEGCLSRDKGAVRMNRQHAAGTVTEGLEIRSLEIPEIKLLRAAKRQDSRGWVMPSFSLNGLRAAGIDFVPLHENHCLSPRRGTVRG